MKLDFWGNIRFLHTIDPSLGLHKLELSDLTAAWPHPPVPALLVQPNKAGAWERS